VLLEIKKYIRLSLLFSGIWFFAAAINALLSATITGFFVPGCPFLLSMYLIVVTASYILSLPFVVLAWALATNFFIQGSRGEKLYQQVFSCSFYVGILGSVLFSRFLAEAFGKAWPGLACSIVISPVCAVLVFRKALKSII
jgi:hypothetical protein